MSRDIPADADPELRTLDHAEGMEQLATLVLERFERSSGVRTTLLYGGAREIARRDGGRRILPFNLLLDADPPDFDRSAGEFWSPGGSRDA